MNFSKDSELHLIIGNMFSGKTTEIIRLAKNYQSIGKKVLIINYEEDKRYSSSQLVSHNLEKINCIFIKELDESTLNLFEYITSDIVLINEAQFYNNLVNFCQRVLKDNQKIYCSGLDGDFQQKKFGEILDLIPLADSVKKLTAFCGICKNGTIAPFTKRINNSSNTEQKLIGVNEYLPVCRNHLSFE